MLERNKESAREQSDRIKERMNKVRKKVTMVKKKHNIRKQVVQVNYELNKSLIVREVSELLM
jgi:hypothetical protein